MTFQFNRNQNYGADDDSYKSILDIEPVAPFSISESWNLISGTIIPLAQKDIGYGQLLDEATLWRTISDNDKKRFYFKSVLQPAVYWVDLASSILGRAALLPAPKHTVRNRLPGKSQAR